MTEQLTNGHKHVKICDLDVTIRPTTCDGKEIEITFSDSLTAQAKQRHFLNEFRELSSSILLTLCNADYTSFMFKIAIIQQSNSKVMKKMGICCFVIDSKPQECAMAIAASNNFQN